MSEFERIVEAARLPSGEQVLEASPQECAALAKRFGLIAISSLSARIELAHDGDAVRATGQVKAEVVQSCAVSGEDLPASIAEPIALRFVPAARDLAVEHELDEAELDEIEMDNGRFDLGEAVAQSVALAIDPYAEGPGAEEARRKAGILAEGQNGPLAALKDLLKK